jgi:hypothetical protein
VTKTPKEPLNNIRAQHIIETWGKKEARKYYPSKD